MKKNRINAYWLLLLVLLYTAAAVLSVGEAQARYVTTATWSTVVQQTEEKPTVTSDCLEAVAEADDFMILLGTLDKVQYEIPFTLTSEEDVSGLLKWEVNIPQYVGVDMMINNAFIDPTKPIDIAAGETVTVVMTLSMPETVFTEAREALDLTVAVTWDDTLRGTFLAQLPSVVEESTEEEESDEEDNSDGSGEGSSGESGEGTSGGSGESGEGTSGGTGGDNSGGTGEDTSGGSGGNTSGGTGEDPTEATEAPAETTEPPAEETQPTETGAGVSGFRHRVFSHKLSERPGTALTPNTENSDGETAPEDEATEPVTETEPTTETEPSTPDEPVGQADEPADPEKPAGEGENSDESSDENTEETTDPTEPVQEEPPVITIDANPVNSAEALPVQITAPKTGGAIRLGLATVVEPADSEGESQTVLDTFPKYTRFRLTEGHSWFMLYNEDTIALDVNAGETLSVLLDLSRVALEQLQVVLGAQPQAEKASISTYTTLVIPESAQHTTLNSRILSDKMPLEIEVSEFWKGYDLEYTVEMLTTIKSEDGETETVAYETVKLPEGSLKVEFVSSETGTKLIFTIGETLPPAGTYRVSLNWKSEDTCYAQMQEIFFINYLAYTESEETGGAEQ